MSLRGYTNGNGGLTAGAFYSPINNFFQLLVSLLQFHVKVLTEGDVTFVEGILTDIQSNFITVVGHSGVNYIPIDQIAIIARTHHHVNTV